MKRALSLVLAVILSLGLATVAQAALTISGVTRESIDYNNQNVDYYNIQAGRVLEFPLTANMFEWSDGTAGAAGTPVTRSQLTSARVDVRYSGSDVSMIQSISIAEASTFSVTNNQKTAYVKVEFKNTVQVNPRDFRISVYLTYRNNRIETSRLVMDGTFQNTTKPVSSNDDYVDISKGEVLVPTDYISSIDVEIGASVIIKARLYSDRRYYGKAESKITSADSKVMDKFGNYIDYIITLSTYNLKGSGKVVDLSNYVDFYVYDVKGNYLGMSSSLVAYSDKYYLSTKQINLASVLGTAGSSSSSSSSSKVVASSSTSTSTSTPTMSNTVITKEVAASQAQAAVSNARNTGYKTTSVRFKNYGSISADALRAMNNAGSSYGVTVALMADTMSGNAVVGRLNINTALARNLGGDIRLGARTDQASTEATRSKFTKWFSNRMAVVALDQKVTYGMQVTLAVKVDLSGMNTNNLYFYAYNKATNEYFAIKNPGSFVDTNGYLHFSTTAAGEILISSGPLTKR